MHARPCHAHPRRADRVPQRGCHRPAVCAPARARRLRCGHGAHLASDAGGPGQCRPHRRDEGRPHRRHRRGTQHLGAGAAVHDGRRSACRYGHRPPCHLHRTRRYPPGRNGRAHHGEGVPFVVQPGEIIGLAGLAGHGQDALLRRLWTSARGVTVAKRRAYVPGDRQTSGIFPLWSVAENLTVSASRQLSSGGVIRSARKRALADEWVQRLSVKGGARAPITSLSGGNQQKVLVARAFATDAALVLLDDPFRGVDVATKNELYALMRVEASRGRSIVWYSTENSEMAHCDRVYVFRSGRIVSELAGDDITEDRIIADSFGGDDRTQEDAR
ncbi:ATP-binding cassette domain-containing protein [Microbacterium lushaniae]|uniref:Sugar ABC transporter ATP-binding protein n=1 Tax=Microbacterium lushaniae TaxID=2614639 RepID=A0A5J6L8Z6_9MICO|nr:ATP-binding cassette domain-containing protein [Microbacterium lushaniae]QEW04930.1 sugar ABC transporter ATP-binding protein [Microbacterium lushaniae]